jgi:hypothetical protein
MLDGVKIENRNVPVRDVMFYMILSTADFLLPTTDTLGS